MIALVNKPLQMHLEEPQFTYSVCVPFTEN